MWGKLGPNSNRTSGVRMMVSATRSRALRISASVIGRTGSIAALSDRLLAHPGAGNPDRRRAERQQRVVVALEVEFGAPALLGLGAQRGMLGDADVIGRQLA